MRFEAEVVRTNPNGDVVIRYTDQDWDTYCPGENKLAIADPAHLEQRHDVRETIVRDEAELESLIKRDPSRVESGLVFLAEQRKTPGRGRLDLLGVDSEGVLAVVELKIVKDEGQLQQALNYYDWVLDNIDFIRDAYKHKLAEKNREVKDEMPRLILVAPEFEPSLITAAKYVRDDIALTLFRYKALNVKDKKELVFFEVQLPQAKEIEEKPRAIGDFLEYAHDRTVGNAFRKTVWFFTKLSNEEPQQIRHHYAFRFGGRKFAEAHLRRGYFYLSLKTQNDWIRSPNLKSYVDIKDLKDEITNALKAVGAQKQGILS